MLLNELVPYKEERKNRKRVGRGSGSGWGKTAGKGHKGQNARAGGGVKPGFEGGQMPLARRLPKRGFKNALFKTVYEPVNLDTIVAMFEGASEVTLADIYNRGLAKKNAPVKILGRTAETFSAAITVEAHRFSGSAREAIEKAGGTVKQIEPVASTKEQAAE